MTTLTVLEHPLSPYAQKVKLALHFKGLPFEVAQPIGGADLTDFLSASPRGEVPVLQHDGRSLYHSSVIGAYIDECWPEPPMMPAAPEARAGVRLLEEAMDTHFEANTWGLGEVHIFGRARGQRAEHMAAYAQEQIQGWYAWLEARLEASWFGGQAYGYADMCVVPFVNGALRFDIAPAAGSALAAWLERVNARDDVAAVTAQARDAELDPDTMQAAVAAGFKREYRDHRLEWMVRAGGVDIVEGGITNETIRFNPHF